VQTHVTVIGSNQCADDFHHKAGAGRYLPAVVSQPDHQQRQAQCNEPDAVLHLPERKAQAQGNEGSVDGQAANKRHRALVALAHAGCVHQAQVHGHGHEHPYQDDR
jgi:hypothetical protein